MDQASDTLTQMEHVTPGVSNISEEHWDGRYRLIGADQVSWFQQEPTTSLELIDLLANSVDTPIIDIGGGASNLIDHLLHRSYRDLTVLDISAVALDTAQQRLGDADVTWIHEDVLTWRPTPRWELWHDRAVLHFLTDKQDQTTYVSMLRQTLTPTGAFIIGTFAEDGPTQCSSLPVCRYGPSDLSALIGDFELIEQRREIHRTPGGIEQPFTWIAGRV